MGDRGVSELAGAINGALREPRAIDIGDNEWGDKGMIALSEAIDRDALPMLETLFMDVNNIGGDGMIRFSSILKANPRLLPSLQELYVKENSFDEQGIEQFSEALVAGSLISLRIVCVNEEHTTNQALIDVCTNRGIVITHLRKNSDT